MKVKASYEDLWPFWLDDACYRVARGARLLDCPSEVSAATWDKIKDRIPALEAEHGVDIRGDGGADGFEVCVARYGWVFDLLGLADGDRRLEHALYGVLLGYDGPSIDGFLSRAVEDDTDRVQTGDRPETDPCGACDGTGAIAERREDCYYDPAHRCGDCAGTGLAEPDLDGAVAYWTCRPDDERLSHATVAEAVDAYLEAFLLPAGGWSADLPATVEVVGFARVRPELIAGSTLERTLEWLDEEYGNPDDAWTSPTDGMRAAERAYHAAVLAEYEAWACVPCVRRMVDLRRWIAGDREET